MIRQNKSYRNLWEVLKSDKKIVLEFELSISSSSETNHEIGLWKNGISKAKHRDDIYNAKFPHGRIFYETSNFLKDDKRIFRLKAELEDEAYPFSISKPDAFSTVTLVTEDKENE